MRCEWAKGMEKYHDEEWGVPLHEDPKLFEFLLLEGAQAGLSWITILRKRENYRRVFDGFDPAKIAKYGPDKINELLNNPGIVRNRLKINSAIRNARVFLKIQKEFGTFDKYIWQFIGGRPIQHTWQTLEDIPVKIQEAESMSKDLKKRGMNFVGPTICYAFMQAIGMVNDHLVDCFRYSIIREGQ